MRRVLFACAGLALLALVIPAQATVAIAIDLSHQKMHVNGASGAYDWPISSGRSGFYTPGGSFAPTHMEVMHYSHKYHMSPMPHAIFFRGGYAIHGTYATGSLGSPASHGCVRLSPGNAARLYEMVKSEGARISISGEPPQGRSRHRDDDGAGQYMTRDDSNGDWAEDAAPTRRHRRAAARVPAESVYYGYHFIGRQNGHKMYQADPALGYGTPTSAWSSEFD